MRPATTTAAVILAAFMGSTGAPAGAEILAMMNYESKTAESLKALRLAGPAAREEGIAIVDVDPSSESFGKMLMNIPLPADLLAHHIFYDRTMTKAYISALGKSELRVMDMESFPYRIETIAVPSCKTGEDVIFSEDNSTWYLTCMDSGNVIVGDVATDTVKGEISIPGTNPHGLAVHTGIDRILVTSTIKGNLKDPGETVTEVRASTGEILATHKLSLKESPSGEAPVEILFVPGANPPVAYVTNMFGNTLWAGTWDAASQSFAFEQAFDFGSVDAGVPLEMYFNRAVDRMYVSTGKPGALHVFEIGAVKSEPKLLKTIHAAAGAHHVAITADERFGFVQNALLNLPGLSDGSVTVVDLKSEKVVASLTTLKDMGYNPNCIVLLPEWNHLAGH